MNTQEAAKRLKLLHTTVGYYCRLGILAAEKRGRDWWISAKEVARYQRERRPRGRPAKPRD